MYPKSGSGLLVLLELQKISLAGRPCILRLSDHPCFMLTRRVKSKALAISIETVFPLPSTMVRQDGSQYQYPAIRSVTSTNFHHFNLPHISLRQYTHRADYGMNSRCVYLQY